MLRYPLTWMRALVTFRWGRLHAYEEGGSGSVVLRGLNQSAHGARDISGGVQRR